MLDIVLNFFSLIFDEFLIFNWLFIIIFGKFENRINIPHQSTNWLYFKTVSLGALLTLALDLRRSVRLCRFSSVFFTFLLLLPIVISISSTLEALLTAVNFLAARRLNRCYWDTFADHTTDSACSFKLFLKGIWALELIIRVFWLICHIFER